MLDEMLKSVRAHLYERAVSPLMGSILISWGLWNYKFVLLILSSVSIIEKYRIIDEIIFTTWQQIYLQGMLYPLITSLAYIYLYPYPARYVYQFSRSRQKEISDIKRKIEDDTLLTAKESRAVRREIYAAEEEFQKNLERKSSEIERLKMEIEELEKLKIVKEADKQPGNSKENSAYKPELDELSEGQLKMLKLVGNRDGEVAEKQLINNSSDNHIAAKYNLGELESNGYIRQDYSQRLSDYSYELTHKGRSYLVSNGHV